MNNKSARVNTKYKLEQLVHRLNEHQRRARITEADEAPPAVATPTQSTSTGPNTSKSGTVALNPLGELESQKAPDNNITVDTIIQQLNAIRSGKSFKDTLVQQELSRYVDGLSESEQEALHAYLKGIAQIVSGQVEAGQAEEPSNHGVETKVTGKKSKQIKPNVIKKTLPTQKPVVMPNVSINAPKEDTTPPTAGPIVPKKR
jgi:hypothetical protein